MWVKKCVNDLVRGPEVRAARSPFGPDMAKGSAQNQLKDEKAEQHPAVTYERPGILLRDSLRWLVQPAFAGKDGDGGQDAEHNLSHRSVGGGDGRGQKIQHRQTAQNALKDH